MLYKAQQLIFLHLKVVLACLGTLLGSHGIAQDHPRIYITASEKPDFLARLDRDAKAAAFVSNIIKELQTYIDQHANDPAWIVSRLQMYWHTRYRRVYVDGMDFSHGEDRAPVPTVRFSGSRDWDTDYLVPKLGDIRPYMDDPKGLFLQNKAKPGMPWEWVHPSETGHIVEKINKKILDLAQDAAFLYWLNGDTSYAVFSADILTTYIKGMFHRDPPQTVNNHHNADLMGLQTFEVIHEGVIVPLTLGYDFLYDYLYDEGHDIAMFQAVFKRWAEQEIKYGVPDNNWNLMQARYITYLALALEEDQQYPDGRGQAYYIDQVLNKNSRKQKSLRDVMHNFEPNTGIWPEVAHYSIMVSDDILEVFCLMDKTLNSALLAKHPMLEKAILANFNYLFPHGFTTAYGDAKHARLRFNALELLASQFRKYNQPEREKLVTGQLKRFISEGVYDREKVHSLFQLFYYQEQLSQDPAATSFSELVNPTFYAPNVSWVVQRNGHHPMNGMMISKNGSLGNHSHANGINVEFYAKGMVIAPDAAAGVSYWSQDHKEYFSRFPAHNTVIVDGVSDYRTMNSTEAFELQAMYPPPTHHLLHGDLTYADVIFLEPSTKSIQQRLTGTIRTSESTGYFIDIFRSSRADGRDVKHEYLLHGQGQNITVSDFQGYEVATHPTAELASIKGDLAGYDYFTEKMAASVEKDFKAAFEMKTRTDQQVKMDVWMKHQPRQRVFSVKAPASRAIHKQSVHADHYQAPTPTLVVRQEGEARTRPFIAIIDVYAQTQGPQVTDVNYFQSSTSDSLFVGISVHAQKGRIDHIYNYPSHQTTVVLPDGQFDGRYGMISFQENAIHSIFLGSGTVLHRDSIKIETTQPQASTLVKFGNKALLVDASDPFSLMLPRTQLWGTSTLVARVDNDKMRISGKELISGEQPLIQFRFPACTNLTWEIAD